MGDISVTGSIVFTEIMADPSPPVQLPEKEYLEITNRTGDTLFTGGLILIAGPDSVALPAETIAPQEYIILCGTGSRVALQPYGRVMAIKSFPALNNDGEQIALRDSDGRLLHAVSYTPAFLGEGPRSGGGWSAELTDLSNPFNEPDAWSPSVDPSGGTPGRASSSVTMATDMRCPQVVAVWTEDGDTVRVLFDETVMIEAGERWPADGGETLPAVSGDPADRLLLVPLNQRLHEGEILSLTVPASVTDFAGNQACHGDLRTGIPSDPMAGEILFNELLFDPLPEGADYIEFYNNSNTVVDLSSLSLANSLTVPANAFTAVPRQLLPYEYIAVTIDRDAVVEGYPCASPYEVFEVSRLPSMPDEGGTLILYNRMLTVVDMVSYSSTMHQLFLSGTEGIALEKVSPALPSDVASNWHSASEACGWGTPGSANSVSVEPADAGGGLSLSSTRVSPDGDGFEDVVSVSVWPGGDENIISVTVFNDRGYCVRRLAERFSAGAGATFVWDGTTDSGARLPSGLYMVIAESVSSSGVSRRWKKVCAVLYR
jgi:hypothetical protein